MDGILVVNKEASMTSHDVVNRLRRILGTKKIGHTGTLDPQATGVLVVLVGKACKVLQFLSDTDKTYIATLKLGYSTDTDDIFGNTLEEKPVNTDFDFEELVKSFEGPLHQRVPMASAKKVNGKKLLAYQHQNIDVEPIYQDVTVYRSKALSKEDYRFEISCSSGTYIRSICRDMALKTGNLGCMSSLVRTRVGRFTIEQAQSLDEIAQNPVWYPVKDVLDHFTMVELDDPLAVYQGKRIELDEKDDRVCITDKGEPIAIYEREKDNIFRSKRGLW